MAPSSLTSADLAGLLLVPDGPADPAPGTGAVRLGGDGRGTPADLRRAVRRVHACAPGALVVADAVTAAGGDLPDAAAYGVVDDVLATRELGRALGGLLAAAGVDLLWGPRLDVADGPAPVAGTTAIGEDPDLVTRHARALAGGVREAGVAVCVLDAPGVGALQHGGHPAGGVVRTGAPRLEEVHLVPWELAAWMDALRTAPVALPALGEGPASLSAWAVARVAAAGGAPFHGLVVAGDLDRSAPLAGLPLDGAAVRAVAAGAHLLEVRDADAAAAVVRGLARVVDRGDPEGSLLPDRLADTAGLVRALRARRRWLTPPALEDAAALVAERGAALAGRATTRRRAVLGTGPVAVLDRRGGGLRGERPGTGGLQAALGTAGIAVVPDGAPSSALLVLTDGAPGQRDRLAPVLAARPDAVIVHVGAPATAPDVPHRVVTAGSATVQLRAAVAALRAG